MTGPIGIFDSGLGGLTVANQVLRQLPNESIVYFADTAHVPYGERPLEEIHEFALAITEFLISCGAKSIVMACNMSSAVALEFARIEYSDIPILGMIEPGSRAAAAKRSRTIGVLATTGTVNSHAYSRTISRIDSTAEVIEVPCPRFVPLVEAGLADTEEAEVAVRSCVEPLIARGIDTIVLGCTHYPFLRSAIERSAPGVRIIDPAEETVRELKKILAVRAEFAADGSSKKYEFYASGDTKSFARLGSEFLGTGIEQIIRADWDKDLKLKRKVML